VFDHFEDFAHAVNDLLAITAFVGMILVWCAAAQLL
jgi:hypothetical protein